MKNPPSPVKLVLTAVCIMKDLKAVREPGPDGKMVMNYWPTIIKMIGDSKFLASLKVYDKDNIPPEVIVS
jgi:dynein heavy chain, axonemal